jgi:two-component sensor histidine kinase
LCWREEHGADGPVLLLEWRESGGPPVMPPTRQGFGTRMIERALRGEGGSATFDFLPSGLACTMRIAIEQSAIDRR